MSACVAFTADGGRTEGAERGGIESETTSPPELQSGTAGCSPTRSQAGLQGSRRVLPRSRGINPASPPTPRCRLQSPFASLGFGLFIGQRREKPQRVAERPKEASPARGTCNPALVHCASSTQSPREDPQGGELRHLPLAAHF